MSETDSPMNLGVRFLPLDDWTSQGRARQCLYRAELFLDEIDGFDIAVPRSSTIAHGSGRAELFSKPQAYYVLERIPAAAIRRIGMKTRKEMNSKMRLDDGDNLRRSR